MNPDSSGSVSLLRKVLGVVSFQVVTSTHLTYYLYILYTVHTCTCAYVRAQVEVVMARWMTEETRALLGL